MAGSDLRWERSASPATPGPAALPAAEVPDAEGFPSAAASLPPSERPARLERAWSAADQSTVSPGADTRWITARVLTHEPRVWEGASPQPQQEPQRTPHGPEVVDPAWRWPTLLKPSPAQPASRGNHALPAATGRPGVRRIRSACGPGADERPGAAAEMCRAQATSKTCSRAAAARRRQEDASSVGGSLDRGAGPVAPLGCRLDGGG
jgi:hypothetical protein